MRLVFYLVLSTALIVVLFKYVEPNRYEYVSYLSYFIYGIGLIGLYIFYISFLRIQKEKNCALEVHKQSNKKLKDIKNGEEYPIEQFKELGTKNDKLSVNRILDHIYTEAESKKFDSSLSILNSYKEEFSSNTMRIFGFQKTSLQLGILGTFIGLAMAFKELGNNGQAIDMTHLLSSLKIPFSTSIAGLQVSFILWIHLDYLHQQQNRMFITLEKCIDEVLNLARHAIYRDSITIELQHVGAKLDELSGRVEKGNELLFSQNRYISEGLGKLKDASSDLDSFLTGVSQKQETFLNSVESLYVSLSPSHISEELRKSFSKGAQEISEVMSKHLDNTLERYGQIEKSMFTMNENFKLLQEYFELQAKQGDEIINKHKQEIFGSFNDMVVRQKKFMEELSKTDMREHVKQILASSAQNITKELNSDFEKLVPHVSALANEMGFYNNMMREKLSKKSFISRVFKRKMQKTQRTNHV